ncbi:MAG: feruloyl-CoA synthase, partial [Alphaproteobacteria bacterium]
MALNTKAYGFVDLDLAPPSLTRERRPDGSEIVGNPTPPAPYLPQLSEKLREWATRTPDAVFLAERDAQGAWCKVTYAQVREAADRVSEALLAAGHGPARPVAALSDNGINFAILMMGAMQVGIPFMPVSVAYSLMSENFEKIKFIYDKFRPSLIYVSSLAAYGRALKSLDLKGVQVVADAPHAEFPAAIAFDRLLAAAPTDRVARAYATVGPDSIAKILLTSGSTGMPKGVINTQRMLCSNQAAVEQVWLFVKRRPSVVVDWLPWNHTFGGNFNFNQVMYSGGTIYIDGGKPVPGKFEQSLKNLRDVNSTILYNVPRAYDMLIPIWEKDDAFARHVFGDLDIIFFAGAALPQNLWDRLEALSIKVRGKRIPLLSSLGSTETAPCAIATFWGADLTGSVGLPVPGNLAKLVPSGDKIELRLKGPNITPGYYNDPELTKAAFDEEGWFKIGDAVRWSDPNRPEAGLLFDGRVAENFKLMTGTWVSVGTVRIGSLSHINSVVQDSVVTGHDKEWVGLLGFANIPAIKAAIPACASLTPEQIVRHPDVKQRLKSALDTYNAHN